MDHRRHRGLAAIVIALVNASVMPAVADDVAPQGVGAATLTPSAEPASESPITVPVEEVETVSATVADEISSIEPTPSVSVPAETATPDPARLADDLLARLESEVPTPVLPAASAPVEGPTEVGTLSNPEGSAEPPATPAGSSVIDRFQRAQAPSAADGNGLETSGWLDSPEFRVGLLLAGFIGIAVLARRWSQARGGRPGRPGGVVSVLARYPFGRGAVLTFIEVGPRIVLLHQQSGRGGDVRTVTEFTDPAEVAEMRTRLGLAARAAEPGFGADLERQLGLYDRGGRPKGFGGADGLTLDDAMETVDLTRRRMRRGSRIA